MRDFTDIYQEFRPKIYRYLINLVGEDDAPDLTQIVLLKISRSLDGFRGECSLATWVYRIATNVARDHTSSCLTKQRETELPFDETDSAADLPGSNQETTDREYIRREMNECIRGIIARMPENYRTVLILSEFEELTNPEIAEVLGLSLDTIKIRLHRARLCLRKELESSCDFYRDERNELMCDRKRCT